MTFNGKKYLLGNRFNLMAVWLTVSCLNARALTSNRAAFSSPHQTCAVCLRQSGLPGNVGLICEIRLPVHRQRFLSLPLI